MNRLIDILLPPGSDRRKIVKNVLRVLHLRSPRPTGYYNHWMHQQDNQIQLQVGLTAEERGGPLISIIVPAFNTPRSYFQEMVYSVVSQAYPNWELIIVNASSDPASKKQIAECVGIDSRIRVVDFPNKGISRNTNQGLDQAKGEFVAFLDHDDTLDPFALREVAQVIKTDNPDLVYSDEDKVSAEGDIYFDPHFKPDWSPDLLTHVNYINHLTVIRKRLIDKVGPLDPEKDGAQDYDLVLRVTDATANIRHIPKVLYHWRAARNSTATDFSSKRNITDAAAGALMEHFKRKNVAADIRAKANRPGFYELRLKPPKQVSVIVVPSVPDALVRLYVDLLIKRTSTQKVSMELLIPTGSEPKQAEPGCAVVSLPAGPDFLAQAARQAKNQTVVVISSLSLPLKRNWLERFSGLMQLGHLGAAAPLIVRNGTVIEDCGIVSDAEGTTRHLFMNQPLLNNQTFFGNTDWVRNVDALSGNVVLVRKPQLVDFLQAGKRVSNPQETLSQLSGHLAEKGQYNLIYSDVLFDSYSIRLQPPSGAVRYFSPNLLPIGNSFEIYTPLAAASNILASLLDQEETRRAPK